MGLMAKRRIWILTLRYIFHSKNEKHSGRTEKNSFSSNMPQQEYIFFYDKDQIFNFTILLQGLTE
jgi:hypothetical protein